MQRLGIKDFVHATWEWDKLWTATEGRSIIVPLRHPSTVWRSWCRRWGDEFPLADFFLGWGKLHALDSMCDLDVICIDKQEDARITDWTPVGDEDGKRHDWKLLKHDLRPLTALPIITRHYSNELKRAA